MTAIASRERVRADGSNNEAGVRFSLRQKLSRERAEVLDVVRDNGPAFATGDLEHHPVAAPDQVIAVGNGIYVMPALRSSTAICGDNCSSRMALTCAELALQRRQLLARARILPR